MIIYKATNTKNGKVYIGQTKQGLNRRIRGHVCAAKKQHNQNNHFLNAIRKYGEFAFNWNIIDRANTVSELSEKEKYWVKHYNSNVRSCGYNSTDGGEYCSFTPDTIIHLKQVAKRRYNTPEGRSQLLDMVKERGKNAEWVMKNKKVLKELHTSPELQSKQKANLRKKLNKCVICLEDGKIFDSMKDAANKMKLSYCGLSAHIRGKSISVGGFHFELFDPNKHYDDEYRIHMIRSLESCRKAIRITCKENNENYGSLREAARMLNIDSGSLSRHLKGQLSRVSGYTFIQIEV